MFGCARKSARKELIQLLRLLTLCIRTTAIHFSCTIIWKCVSGEHEKREPTRSAPNKTQTSVLYCVSSSQCSRWTCVGYAVFARFIVGSLAFGWATKPAFLTGRGTRQRGPVAELRSRSHNGRKLSSHARGQRSVTVTALHRLVSRSRTSGIVLQVSFNKHSRKIQLVFNKSVK